jgi:hypothetical protein
VSLAGRQRQVEAFFEAHKDCGPGGGHGAAMAEDRVHGQVFGSWDAPVTDHDEPIYTPIGNVCAWCQQAVEAGDNGRISPMGFTEHRECSLRNVMGGIGHLVDHERYCRGELGTDAGLTRRDSSLLVWEYFQQTHLAPTPEQGAEWKARLSLSLP